MCVDVFSRSYPNQPPILFTALRVPGIGIQSSFGLFPTRDTVRLHDLLSTTFSRIWPIRLPPTVSAWATLPGPHSLHGLAIITSIRCADQNTSDVRNSDKFGNSIGTPLVCNHELSGVNINATIVAGEQ